MKFKSLFLAASVIATASSVYAGNYKVTAQLTEDEDDLVAYIVNYDTKQKVDSTIVKNAQAVFTGTIEAPFFAQLVVDGDRYGSFIVEEGCVTVANKRGHNSVLNEKLNAYFGQFGKIQNQFKETTDADKQKELYSTYNTLQDVILEKNANNPIGLYMFLQKMYEMNKEQVMASLEQYPQFKSSTRVNNYIAALQQKERTSPGQKYIDFEITYDGKTSKLSDFVKPGKYTIVDFWASWCGPCMRQAAVLKEIYAEHKDNGLEIVGVAVWDEPKNTLEAITAKELPWHNMLNAQTIPTDLYGISGIPCIIIIGPDGTILSRDKQGDELKEDVRKALAGELK
ncbi:MAG: AhpC/TSA family protein [Muribaculaceae bacterium]|nr:AhpC/TSA family protein [Muribaculaceae bacterium]